MRQWPATGARGSASVSKSARPDFEKKLRGFRRETQQKEEERNFDEKIDALNHKIKEIEGLMEKLDGKELTDKQLRLLREVAETLDREFNPESLSQPLRGDEKGDDYDTKAKELEEHLYKKLRMAEDLLRDVKRGTETLPAKFWLS